MREQTLRFFQLHNPFYLLSALSMLFGCFGLVQVIGVTTGGTTSLLILIGVLQAYECLVVGLGSYLIRSGRAPRDGRILFLLELVFLVDATYLLTELSAAVPALGAMMALAVCGLGIVKTGVMLHALGLRVRLRGIAFVSLQLGLLLGSPPLAAVLADQGRLSPTGCNSHTDTAGSLPTAYRHDIVESRNLRLVGMCEQGPGSLEAIALHESAEG